MTTDMFIKLSKPPGVDLANTFYVWICAYLCIKYHLHVLVLSFIIKWNNYKIKILSFLWENSKVTMTKKKLCKKDLKT